MRPGYIPRELTPLKGTSTLDHFAVYDIETSTWPDGDEIEEMTEEEIMGFHNREIKPFLVCFYDGTKEVVYRGDDCLLDFLRNTLIKPYRGVPIFAHNGGKFDTVALFHIIRTNEEFKDFKIVPIFQNSRIMSMVVSKSDHAWSFRDSFSLMSHSLKKLAVAFNTGYEKAKMPSASYDEDPDAWDSYCMNDCKALFALLQKFNTTLQSIGGSVGYTTASTAMKTFRHTYLKSPIANSLEFNNLFRKAYYGGRTEIFNMYAREEDGPFYYYDVNSMYPAVMHDYEYPIDRPIRQTDVRLSALEGKTGIMECEIEAPALEYPLLPYHADTGKLLFPVGRWRGYYDLDLVRKADELGYAITPIRCWTFLTGPIFKDFIDTMYLIKKTETGAMREIAKLMMNCFSPDTLIYTEHGPVKVADVKIGDIVYSIDPVTLECSMKKVTATQSYHYSGKMAHCFNKRYDLLVTPNHRLLVKQPFERSWVFRTPEEMLTQWENTYWNLPSFGKITGRIMPSITIGTISFKTDDWLSFMGWYLTEGHLRKCSDRCFQVNLTQKVHLDAIIHLLDTLGFRNSSCKNRKRKLTDELCYQVKHSENASQITIHNKSIYEWMLTECGDGSYEKKIPPWVFDLDSSHLSHLFDTMMLGDGNCSVKSERSNQSRRYNSVSEQLAEGFMRLCVHLGIKTKRYEDGNIHRIVIYRNPSTIHKSRGNLKVENYDGMVHCVTVDNTHTVLAGRKSPFGLSFEYVGQSLYGKFGEKQDMEEMILNPASIEGMYLVDSERGYYTVKKKHYAAHQIVQIATRVTSLAQLKLYSLFEMIASRGGRVYYCDTDSIICDKPLPTSDELGDIKLERGGVLRKGIYLLPKVYINVPYDRDETIKTRAMKGFSKDFQNRRTFEDYEESLLTGDFSKFNEYRVSVCTAKKAIIQHLDGFVTCVEEKQIRNCYDKRVVNDDFSTRPVVVG